ncbi:MAG: helix-turn-helix domain-containing protein [Limisphaerales bacterium]
MAQQTEIDPKQEFRELLAASGWSQAEASRQLGMTPSALSQIVRENSPVRPSAVTLRLFKLLLLRDNPDSVQARRTHRMAFPEQWERDLVEELREIPAMVREPLVRGFRALVRAAAVKSDKVAKAARPAKAAKRGKKR